MKKTYYLLIAVIFFVMVFIFAVVNVTNWHIERMYRRGHENTYFLLSYIVHYNLESEKKLELQEIERSRSHAHLLATQSENIATYLDETIRGIWLFSTQRTRSATGFPEKEREIIEFYDQNLQHQNTHTLVQINDRPFYLVNSIVGDYEVLILTEARGLSAIRLNQLLDSLILTSDLLYFSVLDRDQRPIVYSSLYQSYLPIKGTGVHIVDTPDGQILHIERDMSENLIIAGFSMRSLENITSTSRTFLVVVVIIFVLLEVGLVVSLVLFERYKLKKDKEIGILKEIGALSAGFAHEFRNSLHTLSLMAQEIDEENRQILTAEIDRMKAVMDSLKLSGFIESEKERLLITDLIDESVSLLKHAAHQQRVEIEKHIDTGLHVFGNRPLFITVFTNLIKNSIEAQASHIQIVTSKKGTHAYIEIIDDGKGITPEDQKKIFEPFYSSKDQSGLGLYLVKKIIELHDGSITVLVNKHTVFQIRLASS
ncbi:MAG: HAMP domain-containing histidine kinase [candidate division WOR-3 bacterium]|nr:MAG: HAMP domain-containing histidine kinase [candidate division WOR-3 bacterium]